MPGKNIIVFPTDFSHLSLKALPWVRRMVTQLDAHLHCVYVLEEPPPYSTLDLDPVLLPSADKLLESAERRIGIFRKQHLADLDDPVLKVLAGRPAQEIASYAKAQGATLIIMTTHGHGGLTHLLLGSTAEEVLRHANCPVLSIRGS